GNGIFGVEVTLTLPPQAPVIFESLTGTTDRLGRFDAIITQLSAVPAQPIEISASASHEQWNSGEVQVELSGADASLEALALYQDEAPIAPIDGLVSLRAEVQTELPRLRLRALNARLGGVPNQALAFRARGGEGLLDPADCPLPSGGSTDAGGWLTLALSAGEVAGLCGFTASVGETSLAFNLSVRPGLPVDGELLASDCQSDPDYRLGGEPGELDARIGYRLPPQPFPEGEQVHALCVCPRDALGNALVGEALFLGGSNYHLRQDPFAVALDGCARFSVVGGGDFSRSASLALDSSRGWTRPPRFSFGITPERPALSAVILDGLTEGSRKRGNNTFVSEVLAPANYFVINPRESYPNESIDFILQGATTTGDGALGYSGNQLDEAGFCTGQACAELVVLLLDHGAGLLDPPLELARLPIARRIFDGSFEHYARAPRSIIAPGGRMAVVIEQPAPPGEQGIRSGAALFNVARQPSFRARSARLLSPSRDHFDNALDALVQSVALADLNNDGEGELIACASDAQGALAAVLQADPQRVAWGGSPFVDSIVAQRGPDFAAGRIIAAEQRLAAPADRAGFCHVARWSGGHVLLQSLSPNIRGAAASLVYWPLNDAAPFLGEPRLLSLEGLPAASLRWSRWDAANSRLLLCTAANADCPDGARYSTSLRRGDDAGPNLSIAQPHEAPFSAANWLARSDVANGSSWPARCGSGSCTSPLTNGALLAQVPIFSSAKTYAGRAGFLAHVVGSDRLGWIAPLISASACGDGQRGPGEDCDDGNHDPFDGCDTSCQTPVCGDGILAPSEACDDGGQVAGDGCDAACVLESAQPGERWQYGALLGFVPLNGGAATLGQLTAFAMQRTEAIDANSSLTPQEWQNWFQARRQCRLMGADLASEAQWQWAAQSLNNNWLYGWGNAAPGCTAAAGVHVANTAECVLRAVRPACSMPSGRSAQGICELAGNTGFEWVLDGFNSSGPAAADINPVHRLSAYDSAYRRGGSFSNVRDYARANLRSNCPRDYAPGGFRCVWSVVAPEP
ncbi:MAG: DUF4215 domain-containing protein, partial [Myxococcota bacterium]|nr:DUF4215 domain-containing protein [Myxococcota bacterium]